MKKLMLATGVAALLVLAGCGGSNDTISNTPSPGAGAGGGTTTPPVSMIDSFYSAVLALIGDGAETTTEPVATASLVATAPEDTEPVAVK